MKKRKKAEYKKKVEALIEKYHREFEHHTSNLQQRFANSLFNLNNKYFCEVEDE